MRRNLLTLRGCETFWFSGREDGTKSRSRLRSPLLYISVQIFHLNGLSEVFPTLPEYLEVSSPLSEGHEISYLPFEHKQVLQALSVGGSCLHLTRLISSALYLEALPLLSE